MNKRLIATKGLTYGGKWRAAGEAFEASRRDASVLVAVRHATAAPADEAPQEAPAEPVQPAPAPEVGTKDMTAEDDAPEPQAVGAVTTGRRKYQRRDMRAEK